MVDPIARTASWMLAPAFVLLAFCGRADADGCGITQDAGRQTLTFPSGGVERLALVYVPTGYHPGNKRPLVLDLHGSASDALEQMDRGQWERTAEMNGFIAAELQPLTSCGISSRASAASPRLVNHLSARVRTTSFPRLSSCIRYARPETAAYLTIRFSDS